TTSHEEGCSRFWNISTRSFVGDYGHVTGIEAEEVEWKINDGRQVMDTVPGTLRKIDADLVLLALGFVHPVHEGLITDLGLELDQRKNINIDNNNLTNRQKVFAAGDSVHGASLVVNAIASGRKAAGEINKLLE
ncbi:MAG: glutamate synthase small chain, partial [Bacteroidota bacterium]|nr:glutamate synthase small chain [Bacteroidota bacterium]